MDIYRKLNKLTSGHRNAEEASNWVFSLTPLGVAFCFYFIFLLPLEIQDKDLLYVLGATAGFTGLQIYWTCRGWVRNEGSTVLLSLLGIMLALVITTGYVAIRPQ